MSSEQGLRDVGMRTSARTEGSLRSNGAPAGPLLARDAASLRYTERGNTILSREEAL